MGLAPDPDPGDWEWDDEDDELCVGAMQVVVTDPQLLGTLLGPDGEVIAALYDRRVVAFGFQPSAH